jgi:hypothetical protein
MAKHNYPSMNLNPKMCGLCNNNNACRPVCILEREREHIGSIWSRVTCLAVKLAAAQTLECRDLGDSQSIWCLTIATINKQCKQINKQYTKQYLMTKQIVQQMLLIATNTLVQESSKFKLRFRCYEGLKLID